MVKLHLIQYDIEDDVVLKERIKAIGGWMNFFPKSMILASNLSSKDIYDKISVGYEQASIFIIELNKEGYWGVMPKNIWEWLEDKKFK